jgi:Uma2 family endonuclease
VHGPSRLHQHTYADYVAIEQTSSTKHEFFDGEIYAMAGGTGDHAALAYEVLRRLGNALPEGPCQVYTSDLRIYVEAVGLATFPDGSVICGPIEQHPLSPESTALNPLVLLEVTSPSSETYDTGFKLDAYRRIPSLQDYIVVSHREQRITVHHRDPGGHWTTTVAMRGGSVEVPSLNARLVVDEVYRSRSIP